MSFGENHRNTWGMEIRRRLANATRAWMAAKRLSAKEAADLVGSTQRTVENWLGEGSSPQAHHLIAKMRESDEVFAVVCEMAGRTPPPALTERQRQAAAEMLRLLEGS